MAKLWVPLKIIGKRDVSVASIRRYPMDQEVQPGTWEPCLPNVPKRMRITLNGEKQPHISV